LEVTVQNLLIPIAQIIQIVLIIQRSGGILGMTPAQLTSAFSGVHPLVVMELVGILFGAPLTRMPLTGIQLPRPVVDVVEVPQPRSLTQAKAAAAASTWTAMAMAL
jgi:hypothetical protein